MCQGKGNTLARLQISALYLDRVVNLMEEGIDVGVRISELPDSNMNALRCGSVRRVLCASPGYIERWGILDSPEALANHRLVAASGVSPNAEY